MEYWKNGMMEYWEKMSDRKKAILKYWARKTGRRSGVGSALLFCCLTHSSSIPLFHCF
jgi:hypothetical protein